ncbi:hypothetical protein HY988_02070 [Candidatus Micrarchaeota archaeon]|nr:hypothetical protein [Candidatus Micrarchaeota archaeon]
MDLWNLATFISIFNIILLGALLSVYISNFLLLKSKFSLGLIIFALLILLHNLANIYFQATMMKEVLFGSSDFACLLNGLEALGLLSLVYVTWKPDA